ncbi:MAG: FHA domain-containing protein [Planctomycetota bacterium]|nr:MAG: FHA domain-containing protein [Planctomycetota bacterium]
MRRFAHPFLLAVADPNAAERGRPVYMVRRSGEEGVVVGRGARCHIRIKDPLVSTRHADLLPPAAPGAPWRIVDRGSTNHTTLDGRRLEPGVPEELVDGASIRFGLNSCYVFHLAPSFREVLAPLLRAAGPAAEPAKTDVIDGPASSSASGEEVPCPGGPGDRLPLDGEVLLFCDTQDPLPLAVGQRVVVGRSPKHAQLVLQGKQVSRRHLEFERRPDGIYARDLGSANGTFFAGGKLPGSWTRVVLGQVLRVSSYRLSADRPQSSGSSGFLPGASLLRREGDPAEGIVSSLSEQPLSEILQHIEEDRLSGLVRVVGESLKGQIGFRDGRPLYAATSDGREAEEAVRALLRVSIGSCLLLETEPRAGTPRLARSFSEIILEEFLEQS